MQACYAGKNTTSGSGMEPLVYAQMSDTGLEPVTSTVSLWRASQLRQSPDWLRRV